MHTTQVISRDLQCVLESDHQFRGSSCQESPSFRAYEDLVRYRRLFSQPEGRATSRKKNGNGVVKFKALSCVTIDKSSVWFLLKRS